VAIAFGAAATTSVFGGCGRESEMKGRVEVGSGKLGSNSFFQEGRHHYRPSW